VIPQLVFVIKVDFTLEAKVVVQAQSIVRMEDLFGLEHLDVMRHQDKSYASGDGGSSTNPIVLSAIPMFIIHMLPPQLLKVEMSIALLAVVVILALCVVLPQCVIAFKVEVTVIASP
jgi:hypothetical protein